jgi:hypothetical protein
MMSTLDFITPYVKKHLKLIMFLRADIPSGRFGLFDPKEQVAQAGVAILDSR